MKAITVCQPYASLIVGWEGMPPDIRKRIENRTWHTGYSGPLLIHAGKSTKWLNSWHREVPDKMPFGAIVGQANLTTCLSRGGMLSIPKHLAWVWGHRHAEGPYMWVLENVKRLVTPILYRGAQGMFNIPDDVLTGAKWINLPNPTE